MNRAEILEFLNSNPVCHLATVEGARPRVRGVLIYHADQNGILFQTGSFKDLYMQLQQNPDVEMCFNSADNSKQIRVSGKAALIEDQRLKEEIVSKRTFLKQWVEKQGYNALKVFRVTSCAATVWTRETTFEPKEYIQL